jgi:hypothetical protein
MPPRHSYTPHLQIEIAKPGPAVPQNHPTG